MLITVPTAEREPGGVETREEQPTEKQGRTHSGVARQATSVEGPVLPVVLRNRRRTPWRAKADGSIRKMNGLYRHISEISTPTLEHAPSSEIWILCYCTRASSSDCLATRVYPPARPSLLTPFPRMRSWMRVLQLQSALARATMGIGQPCARKVRAATRILPELPRGEVS